MLRRGRIGVANACVTGLPLSAFGAPPAFAVAPAPGALPSPPGHEAEPNDTTPTATPIASGERMRAPIFPAGDVDVYSFPASAGDRVFAPTLTAGSASNLFNTDLTLLATHGTTVLEADADDGSPGDTP